MESIMWRQILYKLLNRFIALEENINERIIF